MSKEHLYVVLYYHYDWYEYENFLKIFRSFDCAMEYCKKYCDKGYPICTTEKEHIDISNDGIEGDPHYLIRKEILGD